VQVVDKPSGKVILEMHERGTAVARGVPPVAWRRPLMGRLTVKVEIPIEMDEHMAIASMEAFGRLEDPALVEGHRVVSASFAPYERPEVVA
jgi:hypothetical protein